MHSQIFCSFWLSVRYFFESRTFKPLESNLHPRSILCSDWQPFRASISKSAYGHRRMNNASKREDGESGGWLEGWRVVTGEELVGYTSWAHLQVLRWASCVSKYKRISLEVQLLFPLLLLPFILLLFLLLHMCSQLCEAMDGSQRWKCEVVCVSSRSPWHLFVVLAPVSLLKDSGRCLAKDSFFSFPFLFYHSYFSIPAWSWAQWVFCSPPYPVYQRAKAGWQPGQVASSS